MGSLASLFATPGAIPTAYTCAPTWNLDLDRLTLAAVGDLLVPFGDFDAERLERRTLSKKFRSSNLLFTFERTVARLLSQLMATPFAHLGQKPVVSYNPHPLRHFSKLLTICILFLTALEIRAAESDASIISDCIRMGITGKVVDSISGKPIAGARLKVRYYNEECNVVTSDNGKFMIESVSEKPSTEPVENRAKKFLSHIQPVSISVEHENYHDLLDEFSFYDIDKKCTDLLAKNQHTFHYDSDIELVPEDQASVQNPAHGMNLISYDEKELREKLQPTRPAFKAVLNGNDIEVWIQFGRFDPKKRQGKWRSIERGYYHGQYYFLQGKYIRGINNDDPNNPKYQNAISKEHSKIRPAQYECSLLTIESITVLWNGKKQIVPQGLFDHIVLSMECSDFRKSDEEPLKGLFFTFDPEEKSLLVSMSLGMHESNVGWVFRENDKCRYLENAR